MCKYCEEYYHDEEFGNHGGVEDDGASIYHYPYIEHKRICLVHDLSIGYIGAPGYFMRITDEDNDTNIIFTSYIKYCPWCGRKLGENE